MVPQTASIDTQIAARALRGRIPSSSRRATQAIGPYGSNGRWTLTTLVELGAIADRGGELFEILSAVVDRFRALLPAAQIALAAYDSGGLWVTDERLRALVDAEAALGQGPAIEVRRSGEAVVNVPREEQLRRWPTITRLATVTGFTTTHVFPLESFDGRPGELPSGVVSLYLADDSPLTVHEVSVLVETAEAASVILHQARVLDQWRRQTAQLQEALDSRVLIEQAKGVLAARHALSMEEAFTVLRSHARRRQTRLRVFAEAVVNGTVTSKDLGLAG